MTAPPIRCFYALRPHDRPGCQLTATIAYGSANLCPGCDQQRSTLGKGRCPRPLPGPAEPDPLGLLSEANTGVAIANQRLHAAVTRARQHHMTWSAIAAVLGITRQAAQQRYTRPKPATTAGKAPQQVPTGHDRSAAAG